MVAFSSAGFLSSMTANASPLTNSNTSGRRVCCPSDTVNWFTATQLLLLGSSKSNTRGCAPAIEPSLRRYSTVMPSTSIRWTIRFLSTREGGIDASDLPKCVFERLGRQRWIKAGEGLTQRIFQDDIAVARIA